MCDKITEILNGFNYTFILLEKSIMNITLFRMHSVSDLKVLTCIYRIFNFLPIALLLHDAVIQIELSGIG